MSLKFTYCPSKINPQTYLKNKLINPPQPHHPVPKIHNNPCSCWIGPKYYPILTYELFKSSPRSLMTPKFDFGKLCSITIFNGFIQATMMVGHGTQTWAITTKADKLTTIGPL